VAVFVSAGVYLAATCGAFHRGVLVPGKQSESKEHTMNAQHKFSTRIQGTQGVALAGLALVVATGILIVMLADLAPVALPVSPASTGVPVARPRPAVTNRLFQDEINAASAGYRVDAGLPGFSWPERLNDARAVRRTVVQAPAALVRALAANRLFADETAGGAWANSAAALPAPAEVTRQHGPR
jgi:hypothetical protein